VSVAVSGVDRAWGWVAHLRAGGTSAWSSWSEPGTSSSRFLPGAQQLELLRRLNLAGTPSAALVSRVLTASAPGRGRPDLELEGVAERRFGPPPVDPGSLPDEELLRVAAGLLAEEVASFSPAPDPARPRRVRRRYELVGDPWRAPAWTAYLTAAGRPPGGTGAAVHVIGADLPTLLARTWTAAACGEGAVSWPEWLARLRNRDRLPRRVDLPAVLARQLARPSVGHVGLVLDPAALPGLLGVRALPELPDLSWTAGELARRVGQALSLLVTPPDQAALLDRVLRPRLAAHAGPPPAVPPEHRDWVADAATAVHRQVLRAGYPVVGDPALLLPRLTSPRESRESPDIRGSQGFLSAAEDNKHEDRTRGTVLDLAIRELLEGDR
jgi:hypothetical protein